jgi:hypothetical protein
MNDKAIDSENISKPAPDPGKPNGARKRAKKAKPAKKARRAKKAASKSKADGTNKKDEVTEMMKRAKGATLAEIMKATLAAAYRTRVPERDTGEDRTCIMSNKREDGEQLYKIAR